MGGGPTEVGYNTVRHLCPSSKFKPDILIGRPHAKLDLATDHPGSSARTTGQDSWAQAVRRVLLTGMETHLDKNSTPIRPLNSQSQ